MNRLVWTIFHRMLGDFILPVTEINEAIVKSSEKSKCGRQ